MHTRHYVLSAVLFILLFGTAIGHFEIQSEPLAVALFIVAPILFFGLLLFLDVFAFLSNDGTRERRDHRRRG